jgi:hypothetical protein
LCTGTRLIYAVLVQQSPQPTDGIRLGPKLVPPHGVLLDLDHDSSTLVIAFAGLRGFLGGFPAFEFRKLLSSVHVKSAYIRDHYAAWYHRGVVDVGPDVDSVVAKLRQLENEAERVVMIGNSAGGYAALLFGAMLGCETYAFSPQTFVDPELLRGAGDHRWDNELNALLESGKFDRRYGDLAPLLAESEGRFVIFHGALDTIDEKHVDRVRGIEQVTVNRIEDCDHRCVKYLRDSGWLPSFLLGLGENKPPPKR